MKKQIASFFLLSIILCMSISSFSQVKYTSSGNFGIGTTDPRGHFHLEESNPTVFYEALNNSTTNIRFVSHPTNLTGPYMRVYSSGNFYFGIHSALTSTTYDDHNVLKISNTDVKIDFWPQSSAAYASTLITHAKAATTKCYIVDYGPQNFFVYGNGHVYHKGITDLSDLSMKENIKDISNIIDLIKQLRPVSYYYKSDSAGLSSDRDLNYGLIAQEVEVIIPDVVNERDDGLKGICYNEIVALLIKGMQEQQNEIDELKDQFEKLTEGLNKSAEISSFEINDVDNIAALLSQNAPNPFSEKTIIKYSTPNISNQCFINIYDLQGKQISSYNITQPGDGEIEIPGTSLSAGIYIYNLILDGEIISTKQMILTQ